MELSEPELQLSFHLPAAAVSPESRVSLVSPFPYLPASFHIAYRILMIVPSHIRPGRPTGTRRNPPPSRRDSTHDRSFMTLPRFLLPRCLVANHCTGHIVVFKTGSAGVH